MKQKDKSGERRVKRGAERSEGVIKNEVQHEALL
jgi:hypothetical protein